MFIPFLTGDVQINYDTIYQVIILGIYSRLKNMDIIAMLII